MKRSYPGAGYFSHSNHFEGGGGGTQCPVTTKQHLNTTKHNYANILYAENGLGDTIMSYDFFTNRFWRVTGCLRIINIIACPLPPEKGRKRGRVKVMVTSTEIEAAGLTSCQVL